MDHKDAMAIARLLRDISRTLNLQAHFFALYLAAKEGTNSEAFMSYMWESTFTEICADLARQRQYMNKGQG